MSRNLSSATLQALYAAETGEAFLVLLTLDHPDLAQPIRVTSDAVDTVSNGETYIAFPFELRLPEDDDGLSPRARLRIDNIDRQIVEAVRSISGAATVDISIVRAADPDTVEASFPDFRLENVSYDALVVEGVLTLEDFAAEPYPAHVFSPAEFPGVF